MIRCTHYTVRVTVPEPEEGWELTPAEQRKLGERMRDHLDRELELALLGDYAPAIDPKTVVAEQTPGRKRVK